MVTRIGVHYKIIYNIGAWHKDNVANPAGEPKVNFHVLIKEKFVDMINSRGQVFVRRPQPVKKVGSINFRDLMHYQYLRHYVGNMLSDVRCTKLHRDIAVYAHNVALKLSPMKKRIARIDIISEIKVVKVINSRDNEEEIVARVQSESMEDNKKVPLGASKACIDMLERKKYEKGGEHVEACIVCKDDFLTDEEIIVMPCAPSHIFHENCIVKWLQGSHVCPFCRFELPTDD